MAILYRPFPRIYLKAVAHGRSDRRLNKKLVEHREAIRESAST